MVTYGTTAVLVIRSSFQLAYETVLKQPKISSIIKTDCYVDDLLTDSDNLEKTTKFYLIIMNYEIC